MQARPLSLCIERIEPQGLENIALGNEADGRSAKGCENQPVMPLLKVYLHDAIWQQKMENDEMD